MAFEMKEQLKLLEELQRHDARIQELEAMIKAIPTKLEAMNEDLAKVEAMLAREKQALKDTQAWKSQQETEGAAEEQRIQAAKQRASLVKNTKEAMASERELQRSREMKAEREEEVKKLTAAVETATKSIEQHEAEFNALKETVMKEHEASSAGRAEIDAQIADARREREIAAGRVRPDVLKKYSTIRMRRGLAIVAVRNGTCQGCNMNIPPQVFNILQRGDTIELCGTCNRIIYWDKILENPDGKPVEKVGKGAGEKQATAGES